MRSNVEIEPTIPPDVMKVLEDYEVQEARRQGLSDEVWQALSELYEAYYAEKNTEIARLREALRWYGHPPTELTRASDYFVADGGHRARRALIDTADDWLERHDAEVRRGERERCAKLTCYLCALGNTPEQVNGFWWHHRGLNMARCEAAAIRNLESPTT